MNTNTHPINDLLNADERNELRNWYDNAVAEVEATWDPSNGNFAHADIAATAIDAVGLSFCFDDRPTTDLLVDWLVNC